MARLLPAWLQGRVGPPATNRVELPSVPREVLPASLMTFAPQILKRLDVLRDHFPGDPAPRVELASRYHEHLFHGLHPDAGIYRDKSNRETPAAVLSDREPVGASISDRMAAIFDKLKSQNYLLKTPKEEYVYQLANFIHAFDKAKPFEVGSEFIGQIMANHVGQYAGFQVNLPAVKAARWFSALDSADRGNNLVPLRQILRDESRPERAIAFETAMRDRKLADVRYHGGLDHAYGLVNEALGGGHSADWRLSKDNLTEPQRATIRKVQKELDAGRLHEMPRGADRDWYFDRQRALDR